MADPVSVKVTLLAALTMTVGPLAAEYSLILAGALVGAYASLSLCEKPLPGWLAPTVHFLMGVVMALLITPAGAVVALWALPADLALPIEAVLPIVAVGAGAFWHPALRFGPGVLRKWLGPQEASK